MTLFINYLQKQAKVTCIPRKSLFKLIQRFQAQKDMHSIFFFQIIRQRVFQEIYQSKNSNICIQKSNCHSFCSSDAIKYMVSQYGTFQQTISMGVFQDIYQRIKKIGNPLVQYHTY